MVPEVVMAPGEVALDLKQVAKITSRIEGQVERVHVQLGDRIKPGQPLAAISSLQFDQLIEEYLVSKAQADVAENSFRRTEKLRVEDIVSERKLIEDKGRYLETKARFQHIREKLQNMGMTADQLHQLEGGSHQEGHNYTLTSPIAGTVVAQHVVRGQGVAPGYELFEVVDTSRVWVFANLPIEQARKFKEGDLGTILPKGGEPVTAPLTYIAPVADETTRTIRVRFEVANQQYRLRPREYVDVQLAIASPPTLAIPVSAVTTVDKVRGVFVQRETGYAFVPIEVGREGGGWIEVRKGLAAGEPVVVDGVFDLKNVLLKEHIGSGEGG
jgi:cobalt-zinc-cadmium efflux system membrane fusion protein